MMLLRKAWIQVPRWRTLLTNFFAVHSFTHHESAFFKDSTNNTHSYKAGVGLFF